MYVHGHYHTQDVMDILYTLSHALTLLMGGSVSLRKNPIKRNTKTEVKHENRAGYWNTEKAEAPPVAPLLAKVEK